MLMNAQQLIVAKINSFKKRLWEYGYQRANPNQVARIAMLRATDEKYNLLATYTLQEELFIADVYHFVTEDGDDRFSVVIYKINKNGKAIIMSDMGAEVDRILDIMSIIAEIEDSDYTWERDNWD